MPVIEVIIMQNKKLVYWIDLTGPAVLDEIVRLTIIDTNNKVLFNHTFSTKLVDYWESDINGINPEDTYRERQFDNYKKEIQSIFNLAHCLITFYSSTFFLNKQSINLSNKQIIDISDDFRVLGDDEDTIDNLCNYYGYKLPKNIYDRTGINYARAVNYCYHEMEKYRQAQQN